MKIFQFKYGVFMSKKTFSKIVSESAKDLDVINSDQLNDLMKRMITLSF